MRRNSARFPRFHAKTLQNSFPLRVSHKVLALKNFESLKNSEGVKNAQSSVRSSQSFCERSEFLRETVEHGDGAPVRRQRGRFRPSCTAVAMRSALSIVAPSMVLTAPSADSI